METEKKDIIPPKEKEQIRSLELWFRPVYNITVNCIIGYESQLRINDEKIGVLLPSQYQPIADKSSRGSDLAKWAIREACDTIKKQKSKQKNFGFVSVYIPEKLISQKSFPSYVSRCLLNTGIDGKHLVLSLPMTLLFGRYEAARESIEKLKLMNVKVMFLNFGGELTTITNFDSMPSNYVLLDKSLAENITTDLKSQLVAKSMVDLLKSLEMKIIADGVDSAAIAEEYQKLGCKNFLGDHFGGLSKIIRKPREK